MTVAIVLVLLTHLLVPLWLIVALWKTDFKSKISWLATVLGFVMYFLYFFIAGAGWD